MELLQTQDRRRERDKEQGGWGWGGDEPAASKPAFRSRPETLATLKGDLELTSDWLASQKEW